MKRLCYFFSFLALSIGLLAAERGHTCQNIHRYRLPLTESATGPDIERKSEAELSKIGEELAKRFGLSFLSNGSCGFFTRMWFKECLCTLSFYSQQQLTPDESSALVQSLLRAYHERVMATPVIVEWIRQRGHIPAEFRQDDDITYCLGVKITFWNDQFEYIPTPHIARIDVYESKVKLYQLLPNSPYLQVVSEKPLVLR